MADFREIPTPTYEYDIRQLVRYYEKALDQIRLELERIDLTKMQRANVLATQKEITLILAELNASVGAWITTFIPRAAEDGVVHAVMSLGVVETVDEARKIVSFNRFNRELIKTAVADTQDDLMQVSQNIDRKVRNAIREATAESIRSNLTRGNNTTTPIVRDIIADMRKRLGDAVNTGIIDAAGRRWNPKVYAETVVQTKMAHTQRESAINEALGRDAYYGVISSHGAEDACRNWEGKVVKLTPDAEGDFPYVGTLPRREIFHPRCKHIISPIRRLDRLPERLRNLNGI